MLNWRGKRPFTSTHFYPAQLKEQHGNDVDGWRNKIYWGDNLQVMSHLLKQYRGKVDLIYIDPPFDSKADYKKRIQLRGESVENDATAFEEKQYGDIWTNDEYLQFLYERLVLCREVLSITGTLFLHCDYNKSHYIRLVMEEVFGNNCFINEIVWRRKQATSYARKYFGVTTDTIFWFSKSSEYSFTPTYSKEDSNTIKYLAERFVYDDGDGKKYMKSPLVNSLYRPNLKYIFRGVNPPENGWLYKESRMEDLYHKNELVMPSGNDGRIYRKIYADSYKGQLVQNIWLDIPIVNPMATERLDYPTQKPEALIDRILRTASKPGDLVFDCFMGSGTTQAVAMKLGRRFLGADINLGAIQTTTKRLIGVAEEIQSRQKADAAKPSKSPTLPLDDDPDTLTEESEGDEEPTVTIAPEVTTFYTGFEVYNVNNYEIFRNPVQAKELLIEALELQKLSPGHLFDGEREGRMWKIMPVNKIATRQDLNEMLTGLNLKALLERLQEHPNQPAEKITLVCMGHEPDLAATLNQEVALSMGVKAGTKIPLDVQVLDILRDRDDLQFRRDSEAKVSLKDGQLLIEAFYPMNLLAKLSIEMEKVGDWREMVDSVMVDFNYDGAVFNPTLVDILLFGGNPTLLH